MISALPRSESAGPVLGALTGLQAWAALTLVPWWLDRGRGVPALAVVNGQFLALRASAYDRSGGFAAVRDSLAEDTLLGRRLVTPRRLADRRAGQGWTVTLLHPLAVVAQARHDGRVVAAAPRRRYRRVARATLSRRHMN